MGGTVHVEQISDAVVLLEIDNPPANPLGAEMRETFIAALDRAEAGDAVRCLIVTGRGRAFCSGDDLKSEGPQQHDLASETRVSSRRRAKIFIASVVGSRLLCHSPRSL